MLNNLHVLITRPEPACQQLQQAFTKVGINSSCFPLLRYQAKDNDKVLTQRLAAQPDIAVFISQAAVDFAHQTKPLHQWLTNIDTIIAVGTKTQNTLKMHGFDAICPSVHDSEGMLALTPLLPENIAGKQVIIIRGNGGREHLASKLIERGANVQYFESYQRNWLNIAVEQDKVWKNKQINAMVITSESQLKHMLTIIEPCDQYWANECTFIVPSKRIAATGQHMGLTNILISNGASNSAIVTTVQGME